MSRHLSTREVARILGMRQDRVRALARAGPFGLLGPADASPETAARRSRAYAFGFQDLVVLRTAHELLRQGVPLARVRAALRALREQLPSDQPLSGLRIFADQGRVAVRSEGTTWLPETGQTLLDFGIDELAERADSVRESATEPEFDHQARGENAVKAQQAFEHGLELEESDRESARSAYALALSLDSSMVDAYVNLSRLAHDTGDPREAARLCHLALELDADDPVIHFNLALALEDTQGIQPAMAHYRRALELDPDFADAHFNLAGLYESLDRPVEALRHLQAYRKLIGD